MQTNAEIKEKMISKLEKMEFRELIDAVIELGKRKSPAFDIAFDYFSSQASILSEHSQTKYFEYIYKEAFGE